MVFCMWPFCTRASVAPTVISTQDNTPEATSYVEVLPKKEEWESWGKSFRNLLGFKLGRYYFKKYVEKEHSANNFSFWEEVEELSKQTDPDLMALKENKNRGVNPLAIL
uniref:RGS domain-containing protein n=1 Tax=Caenorhabditis tropicalis TaxID=1561998 RepID=A0A1I7UX11_9PELO